MHHQELTPMGPSTFAYIPAGGHKKMTIKAERDSQEHKAESDASIVPLLVLAKLFVVSDRFLPQHAARTGHGTTGSKRRLEGNTV